MDEQLKTEGNIAEETMADYEDHFDDANPWNLVASYMDNNTTLHVTVEGIVNGGAIARVEGLRGFIPASRLSLSYVEDLNDFLLKELDVRVIDVDQADNKLVLSAREILKEIKDKEKEDLVNSIAVGSVLDGVVETLQGYGAFVKLENGLSGLVHISQIANKRIKHPAEVLKEGDEVKVKVIAVKDGKLSLSIKALLETEPEEDFVEKVEIPEAEEIGTTLGDLFKNIKL